MIRISDARRVSGLDLPQQAKSMFVRRYNQTYQGLQDRHERSRARIKASGGDPSEYKVPKLSDERRSKAAGISFVKTRFKKIKSQWFQRKNGKWIKV